LEKKDNINAVGFAETMVEKKSNGVDEEEEKIDNNILNHALIPV
jgi:hypothetical protein